MVTIDQKLATLTPEEKELVQKKMKELCGLVDEKGALIMVLHELGKMGEIEGSEVKKEEKVKEGKPYLFIRKDSKPRNTKNGPMDLHKYYFDGLQYPVVSWSDLGVNKGDMVDIDVSCLQMNTYEGTNKEGKKYKDTTYKILEAPITRIYNVKLSDPILKDKPVMKCTKSTKKSVLVNGEMLDSFTYTFEGFELPIDSWRDFEVNELEYAVVYEKSLEPKVYEGTTKDGEKYTKKSWKPKRATYPIIKISIIEEA